MRLKRRVKKLECFLTRSELARINDEELLALVRYHLRQDPQGMASALDAVGLNPDDVLSDDFKGGKR